MLSAKFEPLTASLVFPMQVTLESSINLLKRLNVKVTDDFLSDGTCLSTDPVPEC